jgi:hypothetical protein
LRIFPNDLKKVGKYLEEEKKSEIKLELVKKYDMKWDDLDSLSDDNLTGLWLQKFIKFMQTERIDVKDQDLAKQALKNSKDFKGAKEYYKKEKQLQVFRDLVVDPNYFLVVPFVEKLKPNDVDKILKGTYSWSSNTSTAFINAVKQTLKVEQCGETKDMLRKHYVGEQLQELEGHNCATSDGQEAVMILKESENPPQAKTQSPKEERSDNIKGSSSQIIDSSNTEEEKKGTSPEPKVTDEMHTETILIFGDQKYGLKDEYKTPVKLSGHGKLFIEKQSLAALYSSAEHARSHGRPLWYFGLDEDVAKVAQHVHLPEVQRLLKKLMLRPGVTADPPNMQPPQALDLAEEIRVAEYEEVFDTKKSTDLHLVDVQKSFEERPQKVRQIVVHVAGHGHRESGALLHNSVFLDHDNVAPFLGKLVEIVGPKGQVVLKSTSCYDGNWIEHLVEKLRVSEKNLLKQISIVHAACPGNPAATLVWQPWPHERGSVGAILMPGIELLYGEGVISTSIRESKNRGTSPRPIDSAAVCKMAFDVHTLEDYASEADGSGGVSDHCSRERGCLKMHVKGAPGTMIPKLKRLQIRAMFHPDSKSDTSMLAFADRFFLNHAEYVTDVSLWTWYEMAIRHDGECVVVDKVLQCTLGKGIGSDKTLLTAGQIEPSCVNKKDNETLCERVFQAWVDLEKMRTDFGSKDKCMQELQNESKEANFVLDDQNPIQ